MFDWMGDAMSDAVAGMLESILAWVKGIVAGFAGSCLDLMNTFLQSSASSSVFTLPLNDPALNKMFQVAWSVCSNVAQPVGYALLGLFIAIEFANISRDIASRQAMSFWEGLGRFLIKILVFKTFLDYCPLLMNTIYDFVRNVSVGIKQFAVFDGATSYQIDKQPILDTINAITGDQFLWLLFVAILMVVALCCTIGATVFIQIIALARYMEIFVLLAVSAIPFITLVSDDTRFIGQSFLTTFLSVCVQGAILVLILAFFAPLFSVGATLLGDAIAGADGASIASLINGLLQPLVFSVVMIMSIQHSREWANKVSGAM